jgi:uncharacterized membrane protein HdeD (DUF308 family)
LEQLISTARDKFMPYVGLGDLSEADVEEAVALLQRDEAKLNPRNRRYRDDIVRCLKGQMRVLSVFWVEHNLRPELDQKPPENEVSPPVTPPKAPGVNTPLTLYEPPAIDQPVTPPEPEIVPPVTPPIVDRPVAQPAPGTPLGLTGSLGSNEGTNRIDAFSPRNDRVLIGLGSTLARNWTVVVARGDLGLVIGLIAFLFPGPTLLSLVGLFAVYLIIDGVLATVAAVRAASKNERWGFLAFEGIAGIVAGILAMAMPGLTVFVFVGLLAAWALVSGALELRAAFNLATDHGRWWLALGGIISIVFGIVLVAAPMFGALVVTWWVGARRRKYVVVSAGNRTQLGEGLDGLP